MTLKRCKLTRKQQAELMKMFVAEVTARTAADLVGINRNSATLFYHKLREIIAHNLFDEGEEYFAGEIEVDESYFTHKYY
jgi:transposase